VTVLIFEQVLAISVSLLWLVVAGGTVKNTLYGNMVEAPCLREMEKQANAVAVSRERQDA
jgi:hypothetical protein